MTKYRIKLAIVLLVAGMAVPAFAASSSELLEKGIYTEETAGNLDEAIKIYQQIIGDAQTNRRYVAEAQLRLGLCHLKKKQTDQATAALEKLIAEFPDQRELVAKARKHLPAAAFPEFENCRQKASINWELGEAKRGWELSEPISSIAVYQGSLLDIAWTIPPPIAAKARTIVIGVRPADLPASEVGKYAWLAVVKAGDRQSARYGDPKIRTDRPGRPLSPGNYVAFAAACEAEKFDMNRTVGVATVKLVIKPLVFTQISMNEIRSNGTIKANSTIQMLNDSDKPLTKLNFINSDFVHVTAMIDDAGRPIEFTETHDRDHYQYEAVLNDPVPPGEPCFYTSEQTVATLIKPVKDQKDVFEYRMQHSPNAPWDTRRVELYRLPAKAELLETTPPNMARRIKDGRTELFVEKVIPPGGSILTSFRYRLVGGTIAPPQQILQIQPAPWADGEEMDLRLISQAGAELGTMLYSAHAVKINGKDAWRIESHLLVTVSNMLQYTRVDADKTTFAPLFSRTKNTELGDFKADYAPGKAVLSANDSAKSTPQTIEFKETAYDNEQVLYLIRRLPLADRYRAQFDIFPVMGGQVVQCRIEVIGREKISTKAGDFDCFITDLAVYSGETRALQHKLWFSADEHHYLVKYDSGATVMELRRTAKSVRTENVTFKDEDRGFSLEAPPDWHIYKFPSSTSHKTLVQLLAPELESWVTMAATPLGHSDKSPRAIADGEIEILKGFFKGYTVRPASWTTLKVDGLPAIRFEADYQDKNKGMVEYRTYIVGKSAVFWFVFRVEKNALEKMKPTFDGIVNSFKAETAASRPAAAPTPADRREAEKLAAQGWKLWGQKKYEEAERTFGWSLVRDSTNPHAWNGLGWSQFNSGKSLNAQEAFEHAIALEPKHAGALNGLGWIAKNAGRTKEAIEYWEKAVAAMPNGTAALNGLASTYLEQKQYDEAAKYYALWLEAEPDNADAKAGLEKAKAHGARTSTEPAKDTSGKNDEPSLAKERDEAIVRGDLRAACDAEMGRVKYRVKDGNPYKDKITIDDIYTGYVEKKKPSSKWKEEAFADIEKYLAEHKNDVEYVWRINHLLSAMARDLGRQDVAAKYFDAALQSYPETKYADPARFSKYQHLVNEWAKMIWDSKGVATAEDFAIDQLKSNKKCDYFFTDTWQRAYTEKGQSDRYQPFLKRVKEAYAVRAKNFPEKADRCGQYASELSP